MSVREWTVLITASALVATACEDLPEKVTKPTEPDVSHIPPTWNRQAPPGSIDERFVAIATQVPGFGGAFLDADGVMNAYLVDPAQAPAARAALEPFFQRSPRPGEFVVLRGDYDFRLLNQWRNQAASVFSVPGVVYLDIDETKNRLVVGVERAEAIAEVTTLLQQLGIPAGAASVGLTSPIRPLATLRDRVRPVQGGLLVAYSSFFCTLGFNAQVGTRRSYLVNSHCTDVRSAVEGTVHYQPSRASSANVIGSEYADPSWFTGGDCPDGWRCRWSDAALGEYRATVSAERGTIARTTGRSRTLGSITIDAAKPHFFVRDEKLFSFGGEELQKIGAITGWTYGPVTRTCVDTAPGGNDLNLCQDLFHAGNDNGDSGSPVFGWYWDTQRQGDNVTLYGAMHGATLDGDTIIFSSLSNIQREFGDLITQWTDGSPLSVNITGPSAITQKATYTWEAWPNGGTGVYTYQWSVFFFESGYTQTLGTTRTQSMTVNTLEGDFEMRVSVTSGSETASDTHFVSNGEIVF